MSQIINNRRVLSLVFRNYWHAGSGRGSGSHLDALCERDINGLPYFPGRQLKGILRHAVRRAEGWGWLARHALPADVSSHEELFFGSESQTAGRHGTQPGLLFVDSAELPSSERAWLADKDRADHRACLFDELFSTAIDERGSAREHTLRGMEVCLPLTLQAGLALSVTATDGVRREAQAAWLQGPDPWAPLVLSLPLVDAVGKNRSRGLGEVGLSLLQAGGH